jgi:hypothetical protein
MSFGNWFAHLIRGPNIGIPKDFRDHPVVAVIAGGLIEPQISLNAMRLMLFREHKVGSIIGATYTFLDIPPYPYERVEEVGSNLYHNTKRHLENSVGRIIFIGHSLGGILSLYVAQRLIREGYGERIHKIFLLGSPLYGLDTGIFLLNNRFIGNLTLPLLKNANRELGELTDILLVDIPLDKIVTIYSKSDLLVHPSQATISGAVSICVDPGHLLMIASPDVARIIHSHI